MYVLRILFSSNFDQIISDVCHIDLQFCVLSQCFDHAHYGVCERQMINYVVNLAFAVNHVNL